MALLKQKVMTAPLGDYKPLPPNIIYDFFMKLVWYIKFVHDSLLLYTFFPIITYNIQCLCLEYFSYQIRSS